MIKDVTDVSRKVLWPTDWPWSCHVAWLINQLRWLIARVDLNTWNSIARTLDGYVSLEWDYCLFKKNIVSRVRGGYICHIYPRDKSLSSKCTDFHCKMKIQVLFSRHSEWKNSCWRGIRAHNPPYCVFLRSILFITEICISLIAHVVPKS